LPTKSWIADQKKEAVMVRFIIGAVAGGLAAWFWGDQLRDLAANKANRVRMGAADTLQTVESKAEDMLDRTKEQVSSVLHAGQDAIRPTGAR
jgi:gas vesicle protein